MYEETNADPAALDGTKLWDEILKAIVSAMPSQLFPLFKEVYGREYPKDTPIVLLGTETSSFQEDSKETPGSTLMDIALLVAGTDYYHLECQMKNDSDMVIRMFAYDVRFAITHSKAIDEGTGEITLFFPHSVVIYPEKNSAIPDHLKCRIVFQDGSEHIYRIPTVRIQTYSLKEIREKHLTIFIPYIILRLRPRLQADTRHPLTKNELTRFVEEAILILKGELADGYLTEQEYRDYVRLFHFAVDRVLRHHPQMRKEVNQMTEPLIKLPSMEIKELQAEIAEQKTQLADKDAEIRRLQEFHFAVDRVLRHHPQMRKEVNQMTEPLIKLPSMEIKELQAEIAEQKARIAEQKTQLADKDAEIRRLQELVSQLSS